MSTESDLEKRVEPIVGNGIIVDSERPDGRVEPVLHKENPALKKLAERMLAVQTEIQPAVQDEKVIYIGSDGQARTGSAAVQKADVVNPVVQEEPTLGEGQIKFMKNYAKTVFNKITKNEELTADDRFKLRVAAEADRRVQAGEANPTRYTYYKVYKQLRAEEAENAAKAQKKYEEQATAELSPYWGESFLLPNSFYGTGKGSFQAEINTNPQDVSVTSSDILDNTALEEGIGEVLKENMAAQAKEPSSTALVPLAVQQAAKETVDEHAAAVNGGEGRRGFSLLRGVTALFSSWRRVAVAVAIGLGIAAASGVLSPKDANTDYTGDTQAKAVLTTDSFGNEVIPAPGGKYADG